MSIALIVTKGYGNGTLTGDIAHVVTRGYDISEVVTITAPNLYANWDVEILMMADFDSESDMKVNFDIEQDIKPNFKADING